MDDHIRARIVDMIRETRAQTKMLKEARANRGMRSITPEKKSKQKKPKRLQSNSCFEQILYTLQHHVEQLSNHKHNIPKSIYSDSNSDYPRIKWVKYDTIKVIKNGTIQFIVKQPRHHNSQFNIAAVYGIVTSYCSTSYSLIIAITLAILNYQSFEKIYTTKDILKLSQFLEVSPYSYYFVLLEILPLVYIILPSFVSIFTKLMKKRKELFLCRDISSLIIPSFFCNSILCTNKDLKCISKCWNLLEQPIKTLFPTNLQKCQERKSSF